MHNATQRAALKNLETTLKFCNPFIDILMSSIFAIGRNNLFMNTEKQVTAVPVVKPVLLSDEVELLGSACTMWRGSLVGVHSVTYIADFKPSTAASNYRPTVCPPAAARLPDSLIVAADAHSIPDNLFQVNLRFILLRCLKEVLALLRITENCVIDRFM